MTAWVMFELGVDRANAKRSPILMRGDNTAVLYLECLDAGVRVTNEHAHS